jgi:1-acyl-sn-glycerol-3-phosphate acyltransferase
MKLIRSIVVWIIGVCFIAVTYPLTIVIWLLTLPFDEDRVVIHWLLVRQSFILLKLLPIWSIRIEGKGKAIKGNTYVIISNHQSMLDILVINCLLYKFKWISKIENFRVPVIGQYLKMADYIVFDRNDDDSKAEMLEISYSFLKKGISIMMFPEGTRSLNNEIGFFKRGAFQLAMEAGVSILPVLIDGTGGLLPKHGLIFGSGHRIRIRVLDPVAPSDFGNITPEDLAMKFSKIMTLALAELRSEDHGA